MDRKLLRCLPEVVADALRRAAALYGETVDEIRMYRDGRIVLVVGGRNIKTSVVCTEKILQETIQQVETMQLIQQLLQLQNRLLMRQKTL